VLTPGRYVGAEQEEEESEPLEEKLCRLTAILETQFAEARRLEQLIRTSVRSLVRG
jgi:type I restriction enzyme M protein